MKTTLLRNMLATIAALFIALFALPQTAQAQNTVTIDGVEKPILSTDFFFGGSDDKAFAVFLYLSADKKEYVYVSGNKDLHAIYDFIFLTRNEPKHDEQWYWSVRYNKDEETLFKANGDPDLGYALFTDGVMFISGDPRPSRKVCGISLYNGTITDTKHGDGKTHTIQIDYKYERTDPTAGTLTVGNVTDKTIDLSWTHANDDTTPKNRLIYTVQYKKKGEEGWYMKNVGNVTSYTVTGLKPDTEYEVDICIWDESGNYDHYGEQTVTTKQAQAEEYGFTVIDGVKKPVLSHGYIDIGNDNFSICLYLSDNRKDFIMIQANKKLHTGKDIDLTKKETKHKGQDCWCVAYMTDFISWEDYHGVFYGYGHPDSDSPVFTTGTLRIDGDPAGTFTVSLKNGRITADTKTGDGKTHTVSIKYGNDPTGIDTVTSDASVKKQGIYNLQGVKLNTAFDRLPAGIYIVDGRKVVKK